MAKTKEDLALSLADTLNKKFKSDGQVAYFIGGENTPTDVTEWVSTGSSMLDLAISNRPHGGTPVGRIIEVNGLESSGKSLVAGHILAETQRKGGVAVYIDTENALSMEFLEAIGIDVSKMLYIALDTVEQIFDAMESIINKVRESNKDRLLTIVVDSLAAATTSNEKEADYSKAGWNTDKAIIVSAAFRKITRLIGKERICVVMTNQLRQKMGVMFGDPWTTSGGKGLPFHASVRLRLKPVGQIKIKTPAGEQPIGIKVRAQVIKNRVGPPLRTAEFDVFFDRGIDDSGNWYKILDDNGIIINSNPGKKIINHKGEEIQFLPDDTTSKNTELPKWSELVNEGDPDFRKFLYEKICSFVIMKYKKKSENGEIEGLDSEIISSDEVIEEND